MNQPTMASATHVVFDPSVSERLEKLGAVNVVCAGDATLVGPSRRSAGEHARVREAWWGMADDGDRLHALDIRWEPAIVLWASRSPRDRVNLWRACARLRQARIPPGGVFIIELGPKGWNGEGPPPRVECSESVADHPDEVLSERLRRSRAVRPARYDRAVSLWDKYADSDLGRFARACARGVRGFPELASVWAVLSAFFPRRTPEGRLRPSRFDELLLGLLSDEWQTPTALFLHESRAGDALRELVSCTGDFFIPKRLDDWVNVGRAASVERAVGPRAETPMLSSTYRITEHGVRLRTEGLAHLTDAPRLLVAGTTAYAAEPPWLVLDDGTLVRG